MTSRNTVTGFFPKREDGRRVFHIVSKHPLPIGISLKGKNKNHIIRYLHKNVNGSSIETYFRDIFNINFSICLNQNISRFRVR